MPLVRSSGRGGPAPDPRALRRGQPADSTSWTRLPARGLAVAPAWPDEALDPDAPPNERHFTLWDRLWTEYPQAHIWKRQRLSLSVAAYVFVAIECASGPAQAARLAALMRLSDTMLINPHAMRAARVVIDEALDDMVDEHTNTLGIAPVIALPSGGNTESGAPSARDRLAAPQAVEHDDEPDDDTGDAEGYLT